MWPLKQGNLITEVALGDLISKVAIKWGFTAYS